MIGEASVENSRNQTPQILKHAWVGNKFHNENGTSCFSLGEATSLVEAPTRAQVCPACLAAHTKIMQTLNQSLLIIIKNIKSQLYYSTPSAWQSGAEGAFMYLKMKNSSECGSKTNCKMKIVQVVPHWGKHHGSNKKSSLVLHVWPPRANLSNCKP